MGKYDSPEYVRPINWIYSRLKSGESVGAIKALMLDADFPLLCSMIYAPNDMGSEWACLVDYVFKRYFEGFGDPGGETSDELPTWSKSSWMGFLDSIGEYDVALKGKLQNDTATIIRRLSDGDGDKVRKGMVIGDARSGKTLGVMGLINALFDLQWNVIIWFVGKSSMRLDAVRDRIDEYIGSYCTDYAVTIRQFGQLDSLPKRNSLNFEKNPNSRFLVFGLKNPTALGEVCEWLDFAGESRETMRVLVIDERENRSAADSIYYETSENELLGRLLNQNLEQTPFKNVRYLVYTSACYDLFLNRNGNDTIFPVDFYVHTTNGDSYISGDIIFPEDGYHSFSSTINTEVNIDYDLVKLYADPDSIPPESLKDAMAWALCASAVSYYYGTKQTCTMLIPQDTNEFHVISMTSAVIKALQDHTMLERCKAVYENQKNKLSPEIYHDLFPGSDCFPEYFPDYGQLLPIIDAALSKWRLNSFIESGISISYDVINDESIDSLNMRLPTDYRVSYYGSKKESIDGINLCILIAFRNISRGLDVRRLVSTFLTRAPDKRDTNVPIGMWCGKHHGYELLPRIWMSEESRRYYVGLNGIEKKLRTILINNRIRDPTDLPRSMLKSLDKIRFKILLFKTSNTIVQCSQCGKTIIEGEVRYAVPGPFELWRCYDCQNPITDNFRSIRSKAHRSAEKIIPLLFESRTIPEDRLEHESGLKASKLINELFDMHYAIIPWGKAKKGEKIRYSLVYCPQLITFFRDLRIMYSDRMEELFSKYSNSWGWIIDSALRECHTVWGKAYPDGFCQDHLFPTNDFALFKRICDMIMGGPITVLSSDLFRFHYAKKYPWIKEELDGKNRTIVMEGAIARMFDNCKHVDLLDSGLILFDGKEAPYKVHAVPDPSECVITRDDKVNIYIRPDSINVVYNQQESEFMSFFEEDGEEMAWMVRYLCHLMEAGF